MGARSPSPRAQARSPDSSGGGSERPGPSLEGAARQWAAGAASAASVAARSARPSPARIWSPRARRAAFPSSSATAPRAAPPGHTHVRSSFSWFTDFRGRKISPRSLRVSLGSLPLPSRLPLPVGARAHAHTHTHTPTHSPARVRTAARPEPRSLQRRSADPTLSGAATHTGFQPPLGVLCLR